MENKVSNVSSLVKKQTMSELENKLTDHDHDKYIFLSHDLIIWLLVLLKQD